MKNGDKGDYYNAACLYSVMGEKDKAIKYLRKSLEAGFRRFTHISRDRDLDNIRNTDEFKSLIEEYETKSKALGDSDKNEEILYIDKKSRNPIHKGKWSI